MQICSSPSARQEPVHRPCTQVRSRYLVQVLVHDERVAQCQLVEARGDAGVHAANVSRERPNLQLYRGQQSAGTVLFLNTVLFIVILQIRADRSTEHAVLASVMKACRDSAQLLPAAHSVWALSAVALVMRRVLKRV